MIFKFYAQHRFFFVRRDSGSRELLRMRALLEGTLLVALLIKSCVGLVLNVSTGIVSAS